MDEQAKTDRQARIDTARDGLRGALVRWAQAEHHASARRGAIATGESSPVHTRGERIMTSDEDRFALEVRARLALIETLTQTLVAHTALHIHKTGGDAVAFTARLFDDVENNLLEGARQVADTDEEPIAAGALELYQAMSKAMLAHIHRYATPMGSS